MVRGAALAALSGALIAAAAPPHSFWPLGWVALAPLLGAVRTAPSLRRAAALGWLAGLVANLAGFVWVIELLTRHGELPWPLAALGLLLLAAYQALVYLLAAAAIHRIGRRAPLALTAPLAVVSFELLVPFVFPWYLAITQAPATPAIQIAELTGPLGISALCAAVAGATIDAALDRRRGPPLAVAGILAAALAFGALRIDQIDDRREAAPALEVGLVQANFAFDPGARAPDPATELEALQRISAELEAAGAELLVWPEASYPYPLSRARRSDPSPANPRRIRRGFSAPLALGALTADFDRDPRAYNSAILLEPGGDFAGRYDKIHLLLFGEHLPLGERFPWLHDWLPAAGNFRRGADVSTLPLEHGGATYRLGPMICYEDILPAFGRELAALHPHLLVNLTNDTWFGDSAEPWQHLALAVFRSVELRTDMVRATNSGVSAHIDAAGRVRRATYVIDPAREPRPSDGLMARARLLEGGHGLFARFGNVFGWLCVAGLIALLAAALRRR